VQQGPCSARVQTGADAALLAAAPAHASTRTEQAKRAPSRSRHRRSSPGRLSGGDGRRPQARRASRGGSSRRAGHASQLVPPPEMRRNEGCIELGTYLHCSAHICSGGSAEGAHECMRPTDRSSCLSYLLRADAGLCRQRPGRPVVARALASDSMRRWRDNMQSSHRDSWRDLTLSPCMAWQRKQLSGGRATGHRHAQDSTQADESGPFRSPSSPLHRPQCRSCCHTGKPACVNGR
jgi:hypothetical protein